MGPYIFSKFIAMHKAAWHEIKITRYSFLISDELHLKKAFIAFLLHNRVISARVRVIQYDILFFLIARKRYIYYNDS